MVQHSKCRDRRREQCHETSRGTFCHGERCISSGHEHRNERDGFRRAGVRRDVMYLVCGLVKTIAGVVDALGRVAHARAKRSGDDVNDQRRAVVMGDIDLAGRVVDALHGELALRETVDDVLEYLFDCAHDRSDCSRSGGGVVLLECGAHVVLDSCVMHYPLPASEDIGVPASASVFLHRRSVIAPFSTSPRASVLCQNGRRQRVRRDGGHVR